LPSIYELKPRFQSLLRPLVRRLAVTGVTANQVTVAAVVLSAGAGAAIALAPARRAPLLLLPAALLLRMALNAIDGMLAREHGMKSRLGAILNELGDVLSDAALYLPLALVGGLPSPLVVGAVVLAGVTELTGVAAAQAGASRRYDGPMGKSDRAAAFGLLALLLGGGVAPGAWSTALVATVDVLLGVTIVHRARRALQEVTP
jgi:CDP-diacylglycerol--glycerol-3-phosphate 3-phosphatidyltransferase